MGTKAHPEYPPPAVFVSKSRKSERYADTALGELR